MEEKKNIEIFDGEEYNLDDPNDVAWLNHQKKLKKIEEESQEDWDKASAKTKSIIDSMGQEESTSAGQSANVEVKDLMECFKEFI